MSEITHQDYVELLRRVERLENIILSSSVILPAPTTPNAYQEAHVDPGSVEKHIHKILVEGKNERANS